MARLRDQAICTRTRPYSETSQVVSLWLRRHGRIHAIAKGAKRASPGAIQRFSGGFEALTRGELVAIKRRGAALATVTEWDLQGPHAHLRRNWLGFRVACFAADTSNHLLPPETPHPESFDALAGLLDTLRDPSGAPVSLLAFQWCLLNEAGHRPVLERDVETEAALPAGGACAFDPARGGFRAVPEGGAPPGTWRVRAETRRALRAVAAGSLTADADAATVWRASRLLHAYTRTILELAAADLPSARLLF